MRNVNALLLGLAFGAGVVVVGCTNTESDPYDTSTGSSKARVVVSSQGSGSSTVHVTAMNDATSSVALDKTVEVSPGNPTALSLALPAASYTFSADVLSDDVSVGSSSAQIDLMGGQTTQITVAAAPATGSSAGSGATVQIGSDVVPRILGVDVHATGVGPEATVSVHVDAEDIDGDALTFFWSGAGLVDGAVLGSSTLTLSGAAVAAAAATGTPSLHVVAQDAHGAATAADVVLAIAGGTVQGAMSASAGESDAMAACLDAQAQCNASCAPAVTVGGVAVAANGACAAGCGGALLVCMVK